MKEIDVKSCKLLNLQKAIPFIRPGSLFKHLIRQSSFGNSGYRSNHDNTEAFIYGNADFPAWHVDSLLNHGKFTEPLSSKAIASAYMPRFRLL
jgi:hypothetical protein